MKDRDKFIKALRAIKYYFYSNLVCKSDTIIIAGLGRSGTTLLYNSIAIHHSYKKYPKLIKFSEFKNYKKGFVYKTHDYPPLKSLPKHVKVIFLYGNIYNTIISTHKKINEWSKQHHFHLTSDCYKSNDEIFYKDTLGLEKQFECWRDTNFLKVKYENLYDIRVQNKLSRFLNFKLRMIKQKRRASCYKSHPAIEIIKKTYLALHIKIEDENN